MKAGIRTICVLLAVLLLGFIVTDVISASGCTYRITMHAGSLLLPALCYIVGRREVDP